MGHFQSSPYFFASKSRRPIDAHLHLFVVRLELLKSIVTTTEYTQSGNGHFLAYIPSCWKNQPSLVRVGGASPPPFTIYTIKYKVAMYAPAERADILPLISTPPLYVLCGYNKEIRPRQHPPFALPAQRGEWDLVNVFGCLVNKQEPDT
jgi:hypothetical protein